MLSIFLYKSSSFATQNSWDVMRQQFKLNHHVTQPEVQNQLRWLISHPSYLQKLSQSEPYIYHIITEIKKKNLPGELALIPMIESSYDPFAYSGAGAAGLWQFMPGTGTDLGLKQDWWFDARRSIGPSTDAALSYLKYLCNFFHGDWILAVAAYDSGEGTMARIIKNSNQTGNINFWTLPVPSETKAYVPRLMALAEIIQNPERYHIKLPDIRHAPYFTEVNIGSQIDLSHAAKLAGISYQTLIKLNPGFNRWATAPYRPYKLLIPTDKVEGFSRNLAKIPEDQRVSWTRHQVSAGDNLSIIAQKYHTTINLIKELNQLKSEAVKKGQYVLIPNSKNTYVAKEAFTTPTKITTFTALQPYKNIHIVQKNDSFAKLEKEYGVNKAQIIKWNNLKNKTSLSPGQQIVIYQTNKNSLTYLVKPGDSLSFIAKKNNIKLSLLKRLNPEIQKHVLKPGQKIKLTA